MMVERTVSGTYTVLVCDLCQGELSNAPYSQTCHSCKRDLCKGCANWKVYSDGLSDDDVRWVAYCAECDTKLTFGKSEASPEEKRLHGLYLDMKLLIEERDNALEDFDNRIRTLRSKIHEMANSESKSLGRYGI